MRFALILTLFLSAAMAAPMEAGAQVKEKAGQLFFEANRAYKDDRFQQAVDSYLALVDSGFENGQVYFNLGNAYFRLGDLGRCAA